MSIESYIVSKDSYRVVGEGIARPYPLRSGVCSEEMRAIFTDQVAEKAARTLQQYKIEASTSLRRRWRPMEEVKHTYLIETTSTSTDFTNWRNAAIEINHLFLTAGVTQENIEVEIVNPSLCIKRHSSVIPDDAKLISSIEILRPKLISFLQSFAPSHWTSVAFHMRKHSHRPNQTWQPTILISFYVAAVSRFETFESRIKELIKSEQISLELEFLCGQIDLAPLLIDRPVIPRVPIGLKPRNGDSIGRADKSNDAGTLGGWIMLKFANPPKRLQCLLTCDHVVAGRDPGMSPVLDTAAVDYTTSTNRIAIDFPATYDRKHAITYYQNELLDPKLNAQARPRVQKELDRLVNIDKAPIIGSVLYRSGVRANGKVHRMDWALVESPTTYTGNIPPPESSFVNDVDRYPSEAKGPIIYIADSDSRITSFGKMKLHDWVVKRGRTSGDTAGEVNRVGRTVKWEAYNNWQTEEVEVIGLSRDFVRPGDSGSFVTNRHRELVGMVIGMESVSDSHDVGIVSDITDIMEDVRALCGSSFVGFALPS